MIGLHRSPIKMNNPMRHFLYTSHTATRATFLTFLISLVGARLVHAQSWQTVMLQQIAKYEVYLQDLKKGYNIVQQGLTTIGQIKKGDFDLHELFFSSLLQVSPGVKAYGKVADMIAMQVQITALCHQYGQTASLPGLNAAEIKYLATVFNHLLDLSDKDLTELTNIMTDGVLQMDDAQRIGRIDALYTDTTEQYQFLRHFTDQLKLLALQRQTEASSIQNLLQQY